jgi:RimJ/RimL family protein N-acetyltransferase
MSTTSSGFVIRALEPRDAPTLVELRRAALADAPLAFAASPEDDRAADPSFVEKSLASKDDSAMFGAFEGDRIVGMTGLIREQMLKMRHKTLIWGMYVAPGARGCGVGRGLLDAAIDRARSWPGVRVVHLAASETANAARRLYEGAGFRQWGIEPMGLIYEGSSYAEHHFVLVLD